MKVLVLTSEYPPYTWGGVGRYSYEVVRALRASAQVDVLNMASYALEDQNTTLVQPDPTDAGRTLHVEHSDIGRVETLAELTGPGLLPDVIARWLQDDYDVLFAQDYFVAALASAIFYSGIARHVVAFSHLPMYAGFSYFDRPGAVDQQHVLEARLFRLARTIVVPSHFAASVVLQSHNVPANRVSVLPPGVAVPPNPPGWDARDTDNELNLLYVARLTQQKGLSYVPALLTRLRAHALEPRLVILGRGPSEASLRRALQLELLDGSARIVTQPQSPSEIFDYYRAAHIFVSLSLYETFGLAMLEAMACGAIPVGFGIAATEEVAGPEMRSLLVPIGDVDALADRIARLAADRNLARAACDAAQRRAASFTWHDHAAALFDLFGAANV